MGVTRAFNTVKVYITMENENSNTSDLASFIDADQQPERQQLYSQRTAPTTPAAGPKLLDEDPVRVAQRRSNECLRDVAVGELFHGKILGYELRKASNGSPYIRFELELEANNWRMSNTKFLPRNKIGSTEQIAEARDAILDRLGYDFESKTFPSVKLFEIGCWQSGDGKAHFNVKRIYNDTRDYNSFKQWEFDNKNKKKQWTAPNVELPIE